MKISIKSAVAAAAATALGSALLVVTGASAATIGTLSFTPGSGTKDSTIRATTSTSCPTGSGAFTISISGGAFAAVPANQLPVNINGYSTLASAGTTAGSGTGFGVDFSNTIATVAQDYGVTLAAGAYTVKLTCLDDNLLDPAPVADFTGTITFTSATSWVAGAVVAKPTNSVRPTLTGIARVGKTLTCNAGTWSGTPTYSYSFLKNNVVAQTSTTKRTLALVPSDLGKSVTCRVTATNGGGSTAATTTAVKVALGYAPVATTKPKIVYSGTPTAGKLFTAYRGIWSPKATYTYYYIWKRGTTIVKQGATATSYRTTSLDRGKTITLTVKAKRTGYTTGTATSAGIRVR